MQNFFWHHIMTLKIHNQEEIQRKVPVKVVKSNEIAYIDDYKNILEL